MGEVIEKIKWADLPNRGLSKDLSGIGLDQVICFEYEEFRPKTLTEFEILEYTLEKRQDELNAALCIREINTVHPPKFEFWFTQKKVKGFNWAGKES